MRKDLENNGEDSEIFIFKSKKNRIRRKSTFYSNLQGKRKFGKWIKDSDASLTFYSQISKSKSQTTS